MLAFQKYLAKRKSEKMVRSYNTGFLWAMQWFYLERRSKHYIKLEIENMIHPYNKGAEHALKIIEKKENE